MLRVFPLSQRTGSLFLIRVCLLAVAGLSAAFTGQPAQAQDAGASYKFIPEDAIVALVVYPKKVLTQKEMEMMPLEIISAAGLQELGFDPLDVDQVVAFVQKPGESPLPGYGIVIKLAKPVDREKLIPGLMAQTEPAKINGKDYHRSASPIMPSIMVPNDKTVVLAADPSLQQMLAPGKKEGKAVAALKKLKPHHLSAVVAIEPVRDVIQQFLAGAPQMPPPFEDLKTLPDEVASMQLNLDVGGAIAFELALIANDEATAKTVERKLLAAIEAGKEMFLEQARQNLESDDPVQQATARYSERLANYYTAMLVPKCDGDRVTMSIRGDSGMASAGVLAGLLLPAVQSARGAARRVQASNNLKQIGLAAHNYLDVWKRLPPTAYRGGEDKKPLLSWRVSVLPFTDNAVLYDQFWFDRNPLTGQPVPPEAWDGENNKKLIDPMPDIFRSPNSAGIEPKSNYLAAIGDGFLFSDEGARLPDVTDGLSNTIMVVEVDDETSVIWSKPGDWEYNDEEPLKGLMQHPSGAQVLFADGSVHSISANIDPKVLKALLTKAGGEVIDATQLGP